MDSNANTKWRDVRTAEKEEEELAYNERDFVWAKFCPLSSLPTTKDLPLRDRVANPLHYIAAKIMNARAAPCPRRRPPGCGLLVRRRSS